MIAHLPHSRRARVGSRVVAGMLAAALLSSAPVLAHPRSPSVAADKALAQGDLDHAIALREAAVLAAPRDATQRAELGHMYMKAGRFESAVAMLTDAQTLGDQSPHTVLSLALAEIAISKGHDALAVLDAARDRLPVTDYGLAVALAGDPARGVGILNDDLHAGDQSPTLRENLGYAYALAGRWADAKLIVSLDLPANKVDTRLFQWGALAAPEAYRQRVAALLGVPLRADSGAPARLALGDSPANPSVNPTADASVNSAAQVATADLAPVEPAPSSAGPALASSSAASSSVASSPVASLPVAGSTTAQAAPPLVPDAVLAPVPASTPAMAGAASAPESAPAPAPLLPTPALANADPAPTSPASIPSTLTPPAAVPEPMPPAQPYHAATASHGTHATPAHKASSPRVALAAPEHAAPEHPGNHVVQLGAFGSEAGAKHARELYAARYPTIAKHGLVTTEAQVNGHSVWRVTTTGYDQASATRTCATVRQHGDACLAYAGELGGGAALAMASPARAHPR